MLIYKNGKSDYKNDNIQKKNLINMLNIQFFKPIVVSIDDMNRFEKKEIKNIGPIKNTWYDSLINYIPEPIRKSVDDFKDKVASFLKQAHLNKLFMGEERN